MLSERLQRSPRRDSVTAQGVRNLGQQGLSAVANGKQTRHIPKQVLIILEGGELCFT